MTEIETKIGVIGFEGENEVIPLVCLDKSMRTALGITTNELGDLWLKVTLGDRSVLAKAGLQFKAMVGSKTITINEVLANKLDAASNDVVKISTDVDANELTAAKAGYETAIRQRFAAVLANAMAQRTARGNIPRDENGDSME